MTNGEKIKELFPNLKCKEGGNSIITLNFDKYIGTVISHDFWYAEYKEPTTNSDLGVDYISRAEVTELLRQYYYSESFTDEQKKVIYELSKDLQYLIHSVEATPQEPQCKECKWWKDSDGEYRRGCGAESICRINTDKVYQGEGYCYMFEPQESEG